MKFTELKALVRTNLCVTTTREVKQVLKQLGIEKDLRKRTHWESIAHLTLPSIAVNDQGKQQPSVRLSAEARANYLATKAEMESIIEYLKDSVDFDDRCEARTAQRLLEEANQHLFNDMVALISQHRDRQYIEDVRQATGLDVETLTCFLQDLEIQGDVVLYPLNEGRQHWPMHVRWGMAIQVPGAEWQDYRRILYWVKDQLVD